jgi:hypothetical protein
MTENIPEEFVALIKQKLEAGLRQNCGTNYLKSDGVLDDPEFTPAGFAKNLEVEADKVFLEDPLLGVLCEVRIFEAAYQQALAEILQDAAKRREANYVDYMYKRIMQEPDSRTVRNDDPSMGDMSIEDIGCVLSRDDLSNKILASEGKDTIQRLGLRIWRQYQEERQWCKGLVTIASDMRKIKEAQNEPRLSGDAAALLFATGIGLLSAGIGFMVYWNSPQPAPASVKTAEIRQAQSPQAMAEVQQSQLASQGK